MEALTAAAVAALTVYDMVKGVDRGASIRDVRLLEKSGGKSGEWRPTGRDTPATRRPDVRAPRSSSRTAGADRGDAIGALVLTISDGVDCRHARRRERSRRSPNGWPSWVSRSSGRRCPTIRSRSPSADRQGCAPSGARSSSAPAAPASGRATGRRRRCTALLDYEIPGFGEQMRAFGRDQDADGRPVAQHGRRARLDPRDRRAGQSRSARLDSLAAIEPLLDHALETLGGRHARRLDDRARSRSTRSRRCSSSRAVVGFALLMARHLRVFAYARPALRCATSRAASRRCSSTRSSRCACSATSTPGLHARRRSSGASSS